MFTREEVERETAKLMQIREEFYSFLDENIPKKKLNIYDFSQNPKLDAEKVYELFFKLDYQARKLRGMLINSYGIMQVEGSKLNVKK
jgi:hypothetical protein